MPNGAEDRTAQGQGAGEARQLGSGPQDLGALLAPVAGGKYPWAAGMLRLSPPEGTDVLPCESLLDPAVMGGLFGRYGRRFGAADGRAVDGRAVASLWAAYYLGLLTIGGALAWLELRRSLPLGLAETALCLDPETAEPRALILRDFGGAEAGAQAAMTPAIRHHADPLIAAIARTGGLSARVAWGTAAGYLDWIIGEAGRLGDPARAAEGRVLLEAPTWPDGWRNPLRGTLRPVDEGGQRVMRRRVCCLRYALPGVGGCGVTCPLPEGRQPLPAAAAG